MTLLKGKTLHEGGETMDHFEMTEKLREKADVTYEEAKAALENSDWDLLEAIVYLENKGKIHHAASKEQKETDPVNEKNTDTLGSMFQNIGAFIGKMVEKGNRNVMEVHRRNKIVLTLPLTVLVLMVIFFWVTIPAFIVSLFFGFRYRFSGADISPKVNNAMDSVADKAEDLKDNLRRKDGEQ